jgi:DNA-binding NtrC family response regulator
MVKPQASDMPRRTVPVEPAGSGIDCVFLTCFNSEFQVFATLLAHSGIRLHCADTLDRADFLLTVTGAKVLLSDSAFLDGTWYEAAGMVAAVHSSVTLVAVLDEPDKAFWADALEQGGYDLASKPLRLDKLHRAIQKAHQSAIEAVGSESAPAN